MAICKAALKAEGPLSTPTLALRVMAAKRIDVEDRVLAKSICLRLVQTLRRQERRGAFLNTGKIKGVCVWSLPPQSVGRSVQCRDADRSTFGR